MKRTIIEKMNAAYEEFFDADPPARSAVEMSALPKGAGIEIEAIAVDGGVGPTPDGTVALSGELPARLSVQRGLSALDVRRGKQEGGGEGRQGQDTYGSL